MELAAIIALENFRSKFNPVFAVGPGVLPIAGSEQSVRRGGPSLSRIDAYILHDSNSIAEVLMKNSLFATIFLITGPVIVW